MALFVKQPKTRNWGWELYYRSGKDIGSGPGTNKHQAKHRSNTIIMAISEESAE
jgi:hypothetical protein